MNKGFCIIAQNNENTNYVRQAYALALSIQKSNAGQKVSLITNDNVPVEWQNVFDKIIPIPWTDQAEGKSWKIENRWKVFHVTPYDETIVMDADMLVLNDISHWWNELSKRDMFFVSNVKDFRGKTATSRYYRKTFDANNLPNLYSGIYYFKKNDVAQQFFSLFELIMTNWELFYGKYAGKEYQKWCSIDVSVAIASKLLGNQTDITQENSFITFTHMKPYLQGWKNVPSKWTTAIGQYLLSDGTLMLGNYKQNHVIHYVEDEFLTDKMLKKLEAL